jgi:hypothetical protein
MPLWGRIDLIRSQDLPWLKIVNQRMNIKLEVHDRFARWQPAGCRFALASYIPIRGFALSFLRDWSWGLAWDLTSGLRLGLGLILLIAA